MSRDVVIQQARHVLAHHARTFRLASLLLPPHCRDDVAVIYAFCRLVDDTVDETPDPERALADLADLEHELAGHRPRPLVAEFIDVCARHDIPNSAPRELIYGVGSDVGPVRVADDRELLRYAYRVAGTVGLMMTPLLGVDEPSARLHAIDLGIAMQLTNICRDVLEDARRDRVYLPATRLDRAGTSTEAVLTRLADRDALARVVRQVLALAERFYFSGECGLRYIPPQPRMAIAAAGRMYRAIGLKLLDRGADPFTGRTVVTLSEKLLWLLRAVLGALARPYEPAIPHDPELHRPLAGLPAVATAGHDPQASPEDGG